MHLPQSITAMAEAQELMAVPHNIVSPQSNKPIMSLVQDALDAAYLLTRPSVRLTRAQMLVLRAAIHFDPASEEYEDIPHTNASVALPPLPPRDASGEGQMWRGHDAFSMLLPPDLFLTRAVRGGDVLKSDDWENGRVVCVEAGVLRCGQLCKGTLGNVRLVRTPPVSAFTLCVCAQVHNGFVQTIFMVRFLSEVRRVTVFSYVLGGLRLCCRIMARGLQQSSFQTHNDS